MPVLHHCTEANFNNVSGTPESKLNTINKALLIKRTANESSADRRQPGSSAGLHHISAAELSVAHLQLSQWNQVASTETACC